MTLATAVLLFLIVLICSRVHIALGLRHLVEQHFGDMVQSYFLRIGFIPQHIIVFPVFPLVFAEFAAQLKAFEIHPFRHMRVYQNHNEGQ